MTMLRRLGQFQFLIFSMTCSFSLDTSRFLPYVLSVLKFLNVYFSSSAPAIQWTLPIWKLYPSVLQDLMDWSSYDSLPLADICYLWFPLHTFREKFLTLSCKASIKVCVPLSYFSFPNVLVVSILLLSITMSFHGCKKISLSKINVGFLCVCFFKVFFYLHSWFFPAFFFFFC